MKHDSPTLLLVGAGELGSRHLQGLASVAAQKVLVVEPLSAARERAIARFAEVATGSSPALEFVDDIDGLDQRAAVGIIATSSMLRREVVERLVGRGVMPHQLVLEKFLFPAVADYAAVAALVKNDTVVNTPRRRWALYRALRGRLSTPFTLRVRGTGWGLCCNAVHFADIFAFLVGSAPTFDFALEPGVASAKRLGYVEIYGSIVGRAQDCTLELDCNLGESVAIEIEVVVDGVGHRIDERSGSCSGLGIVTSAPPFQSADTGALVTSMLAGLETALPTLAASTAIHLPLLAGFLNHYQRFVDAEALLCPVT